MVTDQTRCLPERNKDDKSDIYIQEIRNTLSKREITEEIFEESRLLDEKDKIIKEKERTITELKNSMILKKITTFNGYYYLIGFYLLFTKKLVEALSVEEVRNLG